MMIKSINNYPIPFKYAAKMNWRSYREFSKMIAKDSSVEVYKNPLTYIWESNIDITDIWCYYWNNDKIVFINWKWETYITKRTEYAEKLLIESWYTEKSWMFVPYTNWEWDIHWLELAWIEKADYDKIITNTL